jgi:soluble lytic murein transglycosylase-like protein
MAVSDPYAGYTLPVQKAARRSKYLAEALESISQPQEIRSPLELAARLGAVAVTRAKQKKADKALIEALDTDRKERMAPTLDWVKSQQQPPAMPAQPAAPPPQAAPQPPPQQMGQMAPGFTPAPQPAPVAQQQLPAPQGMDQFWPALERQESGGRQSAVSPKGAFGVAQLMPGTAAEIAQKMGDPRLAELARTDPNVNRQLGQAYLGEQMQKYGHPVLALAAYNAGPGRVDEWLQRIGDPRSGQISPEEWVSRIPFPETQNYVASILSQVQQQQPQAPAQPMGQPMAAQDIGQPAMAQVPQGMGQGMPQAQEPTLTPRQLAILQEKFSSPNPQVQMEGVQLAEKWRAELAQPQEWENVTVNGLPFAYNKTTRQMMPLEVPPEARNITLNAQQAGIPAPQGTMFQADPLGKLSQVYQPPAGFEVQGNRLQFQQGGPQDPAAGTNLVSNEGKLRDDYRKDQQNYFEARAGYQKVIEAAKTATPAGDIALVFGFMKTLDPGSTVREGEQATVQNSGTIPETVQNVYNQLVTGKGRLSPQQRQQFAEAAGRQFSVYRQRAEETNKRYSGLAQSYGFEPGRVVEDLGVVPEAPRTAQKPAQFTDAQWEKAQKYRGATGPTPLLVTSEAQYRKIPKGTPIIMPDGWEGPKPE